MALQKQAACPTVNKGFQCVHHNNFFFLIVLLFLLKKKKWKPKDTYTFASINMQRPTASQSLHQKKQQPSNKYIEEKKNRAQAVMQAEEKEEKVQHVKPMLSMCT